MARTLSAARIRGKAKKREQPLGIAVVWGLAATLLAAVLIVAVQFLYPHSALREFYMLVHYNPSATLPLSPLYQQLYEEISEEDVLFGSTFSLFCGGLAVGWFAPSYVSRRRILLAGTGLGLGFPLVCLAFEWIGGIIEQNTMNVQQGGQQVGIAAPPALIATQALFVVIWAALCVSGTWAGLTLRARRRNMQSD